MTNKKILTCSLSVCDTTAPSGCESKESVKSGNVTVEPPLSDCFKEDRRESIWFCVSCRSSTAFAWRTEMKESVGVNQANSRK